jgi:hypothetical protein
MNKKTTALISGGIALTFSALTIAYSMNLVKQQNSIQQIKLDSVWSLVNEQMLEIKKLKTENNDNTLKYSEYKLEDNKYNNTSDNDDINNHNDKYITLLAQFKSINKTLDQFKIEQQRLASESKQHSSTINTLSLPLQTTDIAQNTPKEIISEEQRFAQEKTENEQYIKEITTDWEQQELATFDITENAELATQDIFKQAKGMNVSSVNCKKDLCRLEISLTEEAEDSPTEWLMMEADMSKIIGSEVAEINSETKLNDDGSESVIIYLSKQQNTPEEETQL